MYKTAVRWMIRRNIGRMNQGDHRSTLAMFASDATLRFPGDNSWANQHRRVDPDRDGVATHRGRAEIEAFLERYVSTGMQMVVDDILVNGPPWNTRAAVRVHHWAPGPDGSPVYRNRAVLFVNSAWGKVRSQEDYEDTEKVTAFDEWQAARAGGERR